MKVTRNGRSKLFVPVVITLETQDEIDHLLAVLRNRRVCPDESPLHSLFNLLTPYKGNSNALYHDLCKRIGLDE